MDKSLIRRWFLAAILAALSVSATAQPPEPEYTLKVTKQQLDIIIMAMTKAPIPYEVITPILQAVAKQAGEQQKAAENPAGEEKKPTP